MSGKLSKRGACGGRGTGAERSAGGERSTCGGSGAARHIAEVEIEKKRGSLEDLSRRIWEHPETAWQEKQACDLVAECLRENGFNVETGAGGVPTAIRAVWGEGEPVIGLLGEYDALPGMSQQEASHREPVKEGACGHGCGHNLLAAATVGGAIGMKAEMEARKLPGTVVFYGCPAEEVLTGKPFMARGGCFKELTIALAWHPGRVNRAAASKSCGCDGIKFLYHGVTAHAAFDPWNGRSALDAVQLLNTGAEYLREHVKPDVRIHYVITEGGVAPNIVPDRAQVWYYVRALKRDTIDEVRERLIQAAQGAAMMTETTLEVKRQGGCYPMLGNRILARVLDCALRSTVQEAWTGEEVRLAKMLNQASKEQWKAALKANGLSDETQLFTGVAPIAEETTFDSTDVGDVAHMVPTGFFTTATSCLGAPGHSWQVTACSGSSMGRKGMIYAARVLAAAGVRLLEEPELLAAAREEFLKETQGQTYVCPVQDAAISDRPEI